MYKLFKISVILRSFFKNYSKWTNWIFFKVSWQPRFTTIHCTAPHDHQETT